MKRDLRSVSRGTSDFQHRVIYRLRMRGWADMLDLIDIRDQDPGVAASIRPHYDGSCRCVTKRKCRTLRRIRSVRNLSSLYRSMDSLERRRLVMAVIDVEPRRWVRLERGKDGRKLSYWSRWERIMRTWRKPIHKSDELPYTVTLRCRGLPRALKKTLEKKTFQEAETPRRVIRASPKKARIRARISVV